MFRHLPKSLRRDSDLLMLLLIGVLLRFQYVAHTAPATRAHDFGGHVQYVRHVLEHWAVPLSSSGWEMHQPPLYYFLSALWARMLEAAGGIPLLQSLQSFSLLCSILTLGIALWIAQELFPGAGRRSQVILFFGIFVSFPRLLFLSSPPTNDVLTQLVLFLFVALLLRWWKSGRNADWYLCCAAIGVGFLTKMSAWFCVPVLLTCLLLRPRMNRRRMLTLGAWAMVIIGVIAGWFVMMRFTEQYYDHMFRPGSKGMNPRLILPLFPGDFTSFSPVRILELPFNNPWKDDTGRRFFWEYLFKSAFTGEWPFFPLIVLVRAMLVAGMGFVSLAGAGFLREARRANKYWIPLAACFFFTILSILGYRILHSAAPNQDFRFVPHLLIPVAAFAVFGLEAIPPGLRNAGVWTLTALTILCSAFILCLSLFA